MYKNYRVLANVHASDDDAIFLPTFEISASSEKMAMLAAKQILDPFNSAFKIEISVGRESAVFTNRT